ncbi:MAG: penicillin-binding transpeptidase domain-containing protein [Lachnospiraceae bacterium]
MEANVNRKKNYRKRKRKNIILWTFIACTGISTIIICIIKYTEKISHRITPEEILYKYMGYIQEQNYKEMYKIIDTKALGQISQEDFIKRNSSIYEGMEVQNMAITVISYNKEKNMVQYQTSFDTVAGNVNFENEAFFVKNKNGYKLAWTDSLIYPGLSPEDKVRVSVTQAKRGEILDRNGYVLAGKGVASSVGIVPGKLKNRTNSIKLISGLLGIKPKEIEKKLSAKWVKKDSFVPVKTLKKVTETELLPLNPDTEILKEYKRQQRLLKIPGVMISDIQVRLYPLKDAAAHLIGYVQGVTAEDLEKHTGEGYTSNSVIGRSGAEGLFEGELKGQNGYRIYITDFDGNEKEEIACRMAENGKDIKLTIDSELQKDLYRQFKNDKGCSAALDPYTGEVLALVSTPSYDNNDFIMGLSSKKWAALNKDENKPMYNRFRQIWCPGSTFKPVTAVIGLESGAVDPDENYGNAGLSWQKDESWGSYYITTLHEYNPVVLENALVYSDNIYFAKAALKIGAKEMKKSLLHLGFQKELPFEIVMAKSQYSNTENIETEIQLADSGYGQGQVLVNPLHMACIYTAFCNNGNIIKPYIIFNKKAKPEYWIPNAFSADNANIVLEGIKKVVNNSHGTGYAAHREDILLAGKTGTAEIKASKEDDSGTELGWFIIFTTEKITDNPILIISMAEDVKGRGGSGYVVEKDKQVLENWFNRKGA